jgi:enoyl-CoA hydratase/carnithine racemase
MREAPDAPCVLVNADGGVLTITLNRPTQRNSVNREVAEGLAAALDRLESEKDLRVGILTGADGNFCAGMDLKAFLRGEVVRLEGRGFAGITEASTSKPLIAAIEGYAVAGGFEIALSCDLIVASEAARFGLPEVKRGLVANAGGLVRLPRQLPIRLATEMVLTGDTVTATYLHAHGLINHVVAAGESLTRARALADAIAANGPLAVAASRKVMRAAQDWSSDEMFARQNAITAAVFTSADAREGALAFTEKRKPHWRGE